MNGSSGSNSSLTQAPRRNKSNHAIGAPHASSRCALIVEDAWESYQPNQNVCLIQPFRQKRRRRGLPKCVPPLDLTQFNVPDELMDPVQAITCGSHSLCEKMNHSMKDPDASDSLSKPLKDTMGGHEAVESKILSIERTAAHLAIDSEVPKNMWQKYLGRESQGSLSKRLRFEAHIATQNGRDVHRELCGFYFLVDGSLTLYEFRQFGKKINVMPLIRRGIYYHCLGCRRGMPYEIGHITKGATLQFETKIHPNLSDNVSQHKLVTVKVSFVDEQLKRQLLCEGRSQVQCWDVDEYLSCPHELMGLRDYKMLCTFQGMFCSRLQGRACRTLVGLGRHLAIHAKDRVVSFLHLQISLRKFHISLTTEDMAQFWQLLSKSDVFSEDCGGIQLDFCLQALTGGFSEDRLGLIRQIFMRMDSRKIGHIEVHQMKKFFVHNFSEYTSVWSEMSNIFKMDDNSVMISYPDFENFHLGVSTETPSDSDFHKLMREYWQL